MVEVYVGNVVKDLIAFYKPLLDIKFTYDSIYEQINAFGHHAFMRFHSGDHRSIVEFNNYNPKYIGKFYEEIIQSNPSLEDFLETAASCFGFKSLQDAKIQGSKPIDISFETAVDLLLAGNIEELENTIDQDPNLLIRNSLYGHRAGLIHSIGSNGVEFWRQVVPKNIVEILSLLLSRNADPNLWNNIYGRPSTLSGLIASSAHPHAAGVRKDLLELLD